MTNKMHTRYFNGDFPESFRTLKKKKNQHPCLNFHTKKTENITREQEQKSNQEDKCNINCYLLSVECSYI